MFICHCQFLKFSFWLALFAVFFFFFTHSLSCLPLFFFRKTTWLLGICFYYCLDHSRKNCGCSSARRIPKVFLWRGKLFTLGCCSWKFSYLTPPHSVYFFQLAVIDILSLPTFLLYPTLFFLILFMR